VRRRIRAIVLAAAVLATLMAAAQASANPPVPKGPNSASRSHHGASQSDHGASQSDHGASQSEHGVGRSNNAASQSNEGKGSAVSVPEHAEHAKIRSDIRDLVRPMPATSHRSETPAAQHQALPPGRSIAVGQRQHGRSTDRPGSGRASHDRRHAPHHQKSRQPVSTAPQPITAAPVHQGHITVSSPFHGPRAATHHAAKDKHVTKTKTQKAPPRRVPTKSSQPPSSGTGAAFPLPLTFSLGLIPVGIAALVALCGAGLLVLTRRRAAVPSDYSRQPKHLASTEGSARR
jgi:hypothetical protein